MRNPTKVWGGARRAGTWARALLAAGLCVAAGCGSRQNLVPVAATTSFQDLTSELAEAFMARRPEIRVTVQNVDSAAGVRAVADGFVQLGLVDFIPESGAGQSLRRQPVARDGIAVVVHPANVVTNLGMEQVRGIFSGGISNWSAVGGPDHPIHPVLRESGSGTRQVFEQIVRSATEPASPVVQDSARAVLDTVAHDEFAVGYVSGGLAGPRVKALSIDGIPCGTVEIAGGRYPIVRPVFLIERAELSASARELRDFILSQQGREIMGRHGLIMSLGP